MPTGGDDAERKRFIAQKVAHLGQALKRRGQEHAGTTVYEKKPGGDLHGHHLCRVEKRDERVLANYDGYIVDVELIPRSKLSERVDYCTKQRQALPPDFEKFVRHQRQVGMSIKGPRVSHTRVARQILLDLDHERAVGLDSFQSPAMVAPVADVKAINLTGQLELWPKVAPSRLRVFHGGLMPPTVALETRHLQKRRGLSQQQLANRIGISRPQLANGLQGRFPLSDWASARLREALLADHQIIEAQAA